MKKLSIVLVIAAAALLVSAPAKAADMGVGINWLGNGQDLMVLPIKMESGLILEPMAGFQIVKDGNKYFDFGARIEKHSKSDGITPLFGAFGLFEYTKFPDATTLIAATGDPKKSVIDFSLGVYVGGSVPVSEKFDVVGSWGPEVDILTSRFEGGKSSTVFRSQASLVLRWWLWGEK
jgi:hypothetical protein